MKVAFYKGNRSVYNAIIRVWDAGPYSHCEIVFTDGLTASASYSDGKRVRSKTIDFDPDNWDFIDIPDHLEASARAFFEQTNGKGYDLIGQIRFIFAPLQGQRDKFWCSEWVAAALGMTDSWRYGPNGLYATLCSIKTMEAN